MKKALCMIFALVVLGSAAVFAAGGQQGGSSAGAPAKLKSSHKDAGADPIHIAFIVYSWTDDQGQYIQQYGKYLADNFNLQLEYVSAENTAEDTIDAVESLCSKGMDGIVLANTKGFQSWAAICEENKVYYSIMLGQLDDEDDRQFAASCKYFMGSLGNYDYKPLGEIYAKHTIEKGYKNVLITGASPGMQMQTDQMIAGYTPVLDKAGVKYTLVRAGFNQLFTAVTGALATGSYDIIYCPIGVMNFAIGNIYSAKLVGKTKAMGHGTSDNQKSAMDAGVLDMFTDNFTSDVGVNVAMIINAVEGSQYPDWPRNECVYIRAPNFIIRNADDYTVYTQYVRNYTANPFLCNTDAVKNMIISYNKNATFASVKNYVETMSLDVIRSKR